MNNAALNAAELNKFDTLVKGICRDIRKLPASCEGLVMTPTVPAPSEPESKGSDLVPGTIGFDLYLAALQVPRAALAPPRFPREAFK